MIAAGWLLREGAGGWAFIATSVAMGTTVLSLFADLYPRLMVSSTSTAYDLTVQNSASGSYALKVMTVVTAILFPVVLVYQGWTYYVFRARVRPDSFARGRRSSPRRRAGAGAQRPGASPAGMTADAPARFGGEAPRPPPAELRTIRAGHRPSPLSVTTLAAVLVLAQAFVVAELVVRPFQQGADVAALRDRCSCSPVSSSGGRCWRGPRRCPRTASRRG